jgi:hypothetical protein
VSGSRGTSRGNFDAVTVRREFHRAGDTIRRRLGWRTSIKQRSVYAGATHDEVVDDAHSDIVNWLNERYQHKAAPKACK